MKVVGIGGGTGLPMLLRGLKDINDSAEDLMDITAIVAVSDNGGSTGLLRDAFGMPAMGDLRNCLIALSSGAPLLAAACQHRFTGTNGLSGHPLGNLVIAALHEMSGDFGETVELASQLFEVQGRVLPVTEQAVTLCAMYNDGNIAEGEASIPRAGSAPDRLWLTPAEPPAGRGVLDALAHADAIILGPGSLYTSIIPNLLVACIPEAIAESRALKIYVCNLMTQAGETNGFSAADHLRILQTYLPPKTIDVCVLNSETIGTGLAERYLSSGSEVVRCDVQVEEEIRGMGVIPAAAPLVKAEDQVKVRHDPETLARLVASLARGSMVSQEIPCGERNGR